jgi:hypothetical protein
MAAGDIELKVTIDGVDFTNSVDYMIIENSLFSPMGAGAFCSIIDAEDKTSKLKGGEKVEVTISEPKGGKKFKYKFQNQKGGSEGSDVKNKRVSLVFRTKEWYEVQHNGFSLNITDKPENLCKKIFKDYLHSEKTFEIKAPSKVTRSMNMGTTKIMDGITLAHDYYVAQEGVSPSILYHSQENGNEKVIFTNWQKLFEGSTTTKLKQSMSNLSDARVSDTDKANTLYDLSMPQLFTRDERQLTQVNQQASCLITNRHYDTTTENVKADGLPGRPIFDKVHGKTVSESPPINPVNERGGKTYESEGRAKKLAYIAHLLQNEATFKVPFNSNINIGNMVDLDIPRKQNDKTQDTEKQINSKVLVTDCSIVIKPLGQSPRCHMEIRAIKAGFDKSGGGEG